jgi:uncharacterized delta-60 repeat protein
MKSISAAPTFLGRYALVAAVVLTFAPQADALPPGDIGTVLTFPATGTADGARAGTLNPDGSLVMAGYGNSGATSVLARMTFAGAADAGFGSLGLVVYNFNDHLNDELHAIARMNDGRFVACGQMGGSGTDFLVARFTGDGSLDTSFNFSGYVDTTFLTTGVAGLLVDVCNAVTVQSDGKIVAAGYTTETGPEHVALVRYNTDGTLDGGFGSGGKLDINASVGPTVDSSAQALLIQPDGKLLIGGNAEGPSNSDLLVLRLNGDGTLDQSFGDHGIARNSIGGFDVGNAMVLQPDGRIVLAGQSDGDFALARYTSTGALDASFGTGGVVKTPLGPGQDIAYGLTLMPWGRLVAVGTSRISTTAQGNVIAAVSYNGNGSLDTYFGDGGKRMQRVSGVTGAPDETLYGATVDLVNGRLWAVGYGTPSTDRDFLVVEFGLPDTVFRDGFE